MRILVTGGTGLIGSHLLPDLCNRHELMVLTRNVAMAERVLSHRIPFVSSLAQFDNLDEFDAVINLAGEPIVNKRWDPEQKAIIQQSRWDLTDTLVKLCQAGRRPPKVFLSGSAIGYYGRQGDEPVDEDFDQPFDEFSHRLCKKWEALALQLDPDRTRVCVLRTGIVLSAKGGALDKMLPLFRLGLGGPIGNGQQYMSWIHIADMMAGIEFLLKTQTCQGVFNFTAPQPVTNKVFSRALATRLRRPCWLSTPAFALRLMLGEMADLLLHGQNVLPKRLLEAGYVFKYPELPKALQSLNI